ncbi:MAG: STAS domain-containing protein [Verrucomicrobiales bacterium]|nr:STAS domain-containing protein [Verrucomicrobiales bacterium]
MTTSPQPADTNVLFVPGPRELNATNSAPFRDQVRSNLKTEHNRIDLDFSTTHFVDSSGLGALISLHKAICSRPGVLRILNPTPPVQQLLELTRMHRLFEIAKV